MDVRRLDERVIQFLRSQGWWPERRAPELLSKWVTEFFEPQGFQLFEPARELLLTLGGLIFHQQGAGETVVRCGFEFDPTLAWGEADRFEDFEGILGTRLCPVGEADDGDTYLVVAADGRVLCIMDNGWIIGDSIVEALASLILGRLGKVVYAPPVPPSGAPAGEVQPE